MKLINKLNQVSICLVISFRCPLFFLALFYPLHKNLKKLLKSVYDPPAKIKQTEK